MCPGLDRVGTLDGGKAMRRDAAPRAAWDALIVLGSNIRRDGDGYRPVTYNDYDMFGMLSGEIRIIAAVILYEQNVTSAFVFSTAISEKTKEILGPHVRRAPLARSLAGGLGQPAGEIAVLGVGARQIEGFVVADGGLGGASEAPEQVGARGGQEVIAAQRAGSFEGLEPLHS